LHNYGDESLVFSSDLIASLDGDVRLVGYIAKFEVARKGLKKG